MQRSPASIRHEETNLRPVKIYQPKMAVDYQRFWGFWKKIYRWTEKTGLHPRLQLRKGLCDEKTLIYDAWFVSLGQVSIHGYYALPRHSDKKLPAVLLIHGYGDRAHIEWAREFASKGYAALSINLRGHGKSRSQYMPKFPGCMTDGITDPNQFSLTGAIADCIRATDYLRERPEIDKRKIFITGGSLGGGLSLIVGGFDPRIRAVAADVPYLCDIKRSMNEAKTGPYLEVKDFVKKFPGQRRSVYKTLDLVDVFYFAPYIKCPALIGVGLEDTTCPPNGIFKVYKSIKSTKNILIDKSAGHQVIDGWGRAVFDWFEKYR